MAQGKYLRYGRPRRASKAAILPLLVSLYQDLYETVLGLASSLSYGRRALLVGRYSFCSNVFAFPLWGVVISNRPNTCVVYLQWLVLTLNLVSLGYWILCQGYEVYSQSPIWGIQ